MTQKAVILFSGGLDSTTVLYDCINKGYECYCLIFDYEQKHRKEVLIAENIVKNLKITYNIVKFDMSLWGKSFLVNKSLCVPNSFDTKDDPIPPSYIAGRNTIFLSFAISYAETIGADYIATGLQQSPFPDGTKQYLDEMQKVIDTLGLKIKIITPFINFSKADIVKLGLQLKVPYEKTWSCFNGKDEPCGICEACVLRKIAFNELKVEDPLLVKK